MYGISHISVEIPDTRLDNSRRGAELDFSEEFLTSKIGSPTVSRLEPTERTIDIATRVAERLILESAIEASEIDLVVLITQTPCTGGIPHLSARLHNALGLRPDAHFFDVSLGCSGWVNGLAIVKGYCELLALNKAMLVTADPYSKIIDNNDRNTVLLFGDGASATLISRDFRLGIGSFISLSDSKACDAISRDQNTHLKMNGRSVMDFARKTVPDCIRRTLKSNMLAVTDIERHYVHQGSKYIVEQLRVLLKQDAETMPYRACLYGNLVSTSIPALISDDWSRLPKRSIACGFGVGLSAVSTVLTRRD
jgi:3-oxoacyl-[acyl-carrier-protein] synthase-3